MSISFLNDWEFETLDYSKYIHIVHQEKIKWFATNYNLNSEYILPSERTLHLISFCSKSVNINSQIINSVLIYSRYSTDTFYLELFYESDKNWKMFMKIFEFLINPDLEISTNFRKFLSAYNQLKTNYQIDINDAETF